MPFTLAHPALVVPLRRWLSLGALACGAMSPDVGYYLPQRLLLVQSWYPSGQATHSLAAAVGFDALVGLVLFVLWRFPLRPALLGALPEPWRTASLRESAAVLSGHPVPLRLVLLYVSAAVGAMLHVVVDVFTHEHPATPEVLVEDTVLGLPIASLLQWVLSAVGLVLLAWWVVRWADAVAPLGAFRPSRRFVVVVGGALAASALGAVLHLRGDAVAAGSLSAGVVSALLGACAWGGAYVLAASAMSLAFPPGAREVG